MTSADRNDDLSPAQEKLEWVTPKISLFEAESTEGKRFTANGEGIGSTTIGGSTLNYAPS